MVFSQTCLNTQSLLKLIEIDRLKFKKNQQVNLPSEVTATGTESAPHSLVPTASFSEVYLKPEPIFENTMLHESDCEFFQDLIQWCDAPAQEEVVQSIDPPNVTETRAHNTDTLHTPFSPYGWDITDANSPPAQAISQTLSFPASPIADDMAKFNIEYFNQQPVTVNDDKVPFQEQFLDFSTLPVVIGDLASESIADPNQWHLADSEWRNTRDIDYTKPISNTHDTMPFIHQEDSMDMKFVSAIPPRVVENNDIVISEFIINDELSGSSHAPTSVERTALSVDMGACEAWSTTDLISTPEVLSFVEQLEYEKCPLLVSNINPATDQNMYMESTTIEDSSIPTTVDYNLPMTPKTEPESEEDTKPPKKKRPRSHDSEDSDETYTPYIETNRARKCIRKTPKKDLQQMIQALEGAQQQPKKRGRPPGRRESTLSTISNNSSVSTHVVKYRELRDKNNEASKRSRMNRKLKELQMEQLADELEERNKKLQIRVDLLEEMTKKMRDAFMSAVAQKKAG